jgi:hypothetical protein
VDGGCGPLGGGRRARRGRAGGPGRHRPAGGGGVRARHRPEAGRHRAHSILPALVSRDPQRLARANGRLVVTQELAGPPAGGFLFSVAAWTPFAVDAVSFAAGSALAAGIVIPVAALLCLPTINDRTVAEARAAAGLGPGA